MVRIPQLPSTTVPPPSQWPVLVAAGLAVAFVRLGLRLLPFSTVWNMVSHSAWPRLPGPTTDPETIGWAARVATRLVPGKNTCLTRGLAATVLLRANGYPVRCRFGVRDGDPAPLPAHVWIETGDTLVAGQEFDQDEYALFRPLTIPGP